MRVVVAVVALFIVSLWASPVTAEAGEVRLYSAGGGAAHDLATGQPGLTLVASAPTAGQPKVVAGHCDGLERVLPCALTVTMAEGLDDDYMLGDGDPETTGAGTDRVVVHACINQMGNPAFVSRMVYQVYLDDVLIAQRLNNDLSSPAQPPECLDVAVPINQNIDDQTPANDVLDLGLPLLPNGDLLAPVGAKLRLVVEPLTPFAAWWNYFHSGSGYPSGLTFLFSGRLADEASAPAAVTHHEDLTEAAAVHTFTNATSDTYVLNFTTDLVNSTADFAWNATAGSVNVTLVDGNGTVVYNGTFQGNGTMAHDVLNATTGPWNLTLAYSGFNGTFRFELRAPADPDVGGDNDDEPATTDGPTGNGTADPDDTKGNEAPLPLLVPFAALLGAALRRRPS